MKVVILCGGKGLRYGDDRPKGLAMIGDKSIIHHVMNIYAYQGHNDFILILGHKSGQIIDYFSSTDHNLNIKYEFINEKMKTGGALKLAEPHILNIKDSKFMCTYCDSLANINLSRLITTHINSNNIATLTAVKTNHIYGILGLSLIGNRIKKFYEKPIMKEWINGGFFVFSREFFNFIIKDEDILETDIFNRILSNKKLGYYKHKSNWWTVNTLKDEIILNKIYYNDKLSPWYDIKIIENKSMFNR